MTNKIHDDASQEEIKARNASRFYVVLALVSTVVMVIAAYITYGQQKREVIVTPQFIEKNVEESVNTLAVTPDLSQAPTDKEIEKILNKTIPEVCDDCDRDDPLDCLEEYSINKIFVQNDSHKNYLTLELITGKNDTKYTVVIDLSQNNVVIREEGKIDKKECLDTRDDDDETETLEPEVYIDAGDDPDNSHYVTVPPMS